MVFYEFNGRRQVLNMFSSDELKALLKPSRWRGYAAVCMNWGLIITMLYWLFEFPHPLVFFVAMLIIANRQLGLAILMHDAAHQSLLPTSIENRIIGDYFCGAFVFADLDRYRAYHLEHHKAAGTDRDPDRSNYINYPVSKRSMLRKFMRDILGMTGIKTLYLIWLMNAKQISYQLSYDVKYNQDRPRGIIALLTGIVHLRKVLAAQLLFCGCCLYAGFPLGIAVWYVAYISPYMWLSRIRNASEHAMTQDVYSSDPLKNTRTTKASLLARLTFAPNAVNYHLEHHLLPKVPPYHLAKLHKKLIDFGVLNKGALAPHYCHVIKMLMRS